MITSINYLAIAGGIEIITEQSEQAINIGSTLDDLWQSIFVDLSGPWIATNYIASFILGYAFLAFVWKLFLGIVTEQWSDITGEFVYLIILVSLLANNARPLANLALFIRDFTNEQIQVIYDLNLSTVTVESAIRDILITSEVKTEIANRFRACESKTGTLQIECLQEVGEEAQEFITEAQNASDAPTGLIAFGLKVADFVNTVGELPAVGPATTPEEIAASNRLFDGIVESTSVPTIRLILKAVQFALVSMIEYALLLTALVAPIAVALSTIPVRPRPIESWLIGMISLSALLWSYVVLVGFSASVISISGSQDTSELGFLMLLALGSPIVAAALAKFGGSSLIQAISASSLAASTLFYKLLPF